MKRLLSVLLLAVMFSGLLPVAAPPAEMITSFTIWVDRTTAFVGEEIRWYVTNLVNAGTNILYKFDIYRNNVLYAPEPDIYLPYHYGGERKWTPTEPGTYKAYVSVWDNSLSVSYAYGWSVETTVAPHPAIAAVEFASIEQVGGASFNLVWNAVPNATGYEIWRSDPPNYIDNRIYIGTSTSYTDSGLAIDKTYYYKARAYYTSGGNTFYGNFGTAWWAELDPVSPPTPPDAPATITVTTVSGTSIKVTWAAVADVTGYQVYRSTSQAGTYAKVYTGTVRSFTDTGRTAGTPYYYKARAYKVVGAATYNGSFSVVKIGVPLDKPTSPTATAISGTSIQFTWSAAAGATGYQVYRSTSQAGTYSRAYTGTALSFTNTGLTAGTPYYYKVRAYKTVGTSTYTGPFSVIRTCVPLGKPAAPAAVVSSSTSVTVSWAAVTGATGYELRRSASSAGTYTSVYRGTARTYKNTGLTAGKTYYYKVRAYKLVGTVYYYGPYSAYKSIKPI